jgi:uncharacterized protein YjbI with pentapeptide repeats
MTRNDEDPPATDVQAALTVIGRRGPGTGFVDLTAARFPKAILQGVDLTHAGLTGADLSGADLLAANLAGAFLKGTNLNGANLMNANLTGAYLENVTLSGAYLAGVKVTQGQLINACGTGAKYLPAGLTLKPCPPPK